VVREELAAMPAAGTVEHSAKVPVDEAPTPDQASAAIQARAILDSALYRRSWTESDREALQPQFVAMTPAQRDEWLLQYAQAVNQGRLVPEGERPPF